MSHRSGARWLPVRIDDVQAWQDGLLEKSAKTLDALLAASGRVYRWTSVGSPVSWQGRSAWLRVSPFLENEMNRSAWLGTFEAAGIPGVCKPSLLKRIEWRTGGPVPVPVSAEILTLVSDPVASRERFLREPPDLPPAWFGDLLASLAALAAFRTGRRFPVHSAEEYRHLLGATYRQAVPADAAPEFGTEHMDLTWGNVSAPGFQIIDMEHWGVALKGYGAAYLYLTSLAVPPVAAQVHQALADILDSASGRYAQLVAAAIILRNLTRLPDPAGLAAMLRRHTDALLT